ncbi:MAG: hypothetical protein WAM70_18470 [Pyrinomonadaceae bacterium]
MRRARFYFLTTLVLFAGCSNNSTPSDPLSKGIEQQLQAQDKGDALKSRMQVRRAALNHVKAHYSGWVVQGVSIYAAAGNDYLVGVDVISGSDRQTVSVGVELFVQDNGEKYWKTTFVPPKSGAKPTEFVIEKYEP